MSATDRHVAGRAVVITGSGIGAAPPSWPRRPTPYAPRTWKTAPSPPSPATTASAAARSEPLALTSCPTAPLPKRARTPELPVTLDMPGKVADHLRTTELEPAEGAALDQDMTVRRGQGHTLRVSAAPAVHRRLVGRHTRPERGRGDGDPGGLHQLHPRRSLRHRRLPRRPGQHQPRADILHPQRRHLHERLTGDVSCGFLMALRHPAV